MSFRNFQLVEGYLLDFIADISMRKVVCELKLVSPSKVFTEKNQKIDFLRFLLGKEWSPCIRRFSWGNFGTEKMIYSSN